MGFHFSDIVRQQDFAVKPQFVCRQEVGRRQNTVDNADFLEHAQHVVMHDSDPG